MSTPADQNIDHLTIGGEIGPAVARQVEERNQRIIEQVLGLAEGLRRRHWRRSPRARPPLASTRALRRGGSAAHPGLASRRQWPRRPGGARRRRRHGGRPGGRSIACGRRGCEGVKVRRHHRHSVIGPVPALIGGEYRRELLPARGLSLTDAKVREGLGTCRIARHFLVLVPKPAVWPSPFPRATGHTRRGRLKDPYSR